MKLIRLTCLAIFAGFIVTLHSQEATQPTVDLHPRAEDVNPATPSPAPTPNVPELSQLDQVFSQTSLGKTADEYRTRVQLRKLQNKVANEPAVVAAKKAAESARTDLEKRQRLRDYYNIYYGRMSAYASSTELKAALNESKAAHLALLKQPRVRPTPAGSP